MQIEKEAPLFLDVLILSLFTEKLAHTVFGTPPQKHLHQIIISCKTDQNFNYRTRKDCNFCELKKEPTAKALNSNGQSQEN